MTYTQTDPLGGITGPGAESDIYHCLVLERYLRLLTVFKLLIRRPPPANSGSRIPQSNFHPASPELQVVRDAGYCDRRRDVMWCLWHSAKTAEPIETPFISGRLFMWAQQTIYYTTRTR